MKILKVEDGVWRVGVYYIYETDVDYEVHTASARLKGRSEGSYRFSAPSLQAAAEVIS
jgi:hypothetical protein